MADSDVQVKFGASTADAIAGIDQIKSAVQGFTSPIQSAISDFASLGKAIVGAFAFDKIADFVGKFAEYGEQIERTSAMLGTSTTQTQEFGYIAKMTGSDADSMANAIGRLQVNLQQALNPTSRQAQALNALGLSAKQMLAVPVPEQLNLMADAFKKLVDEGVNPASLGIDLMGRGAAGMTPFLEQGRAGLDALRAAADRVANTPQTVEQLAALDHASIGLKAAMSGLAATIVGIVAPVLRQEQNSLTTLIGDINVAIETHTAWQREVVMLQTAVAEFSQWLANLGTLAKDVFTFNWGAIAADRQAGMDKIAAIQAQGEAKVLEIAKRANAQLRSLLSEGAAGADLKPPSLPNMDAIKSAANQYQDLVRAAQEAYATINKLAEDAYSQAKEHLQAQAKDGQITYQQETTDLLSELARRLAAQTTALDTEYAAEASALAAKVALYPQGTAQWQAALDQQEAAYQKYTDDLKKLDAQWSKERQQIVDQGVQDTVQQWKAAADQIASAFNSQLRGLLAGTTTWSQAMKSISGDLILKMIEDQVKLSLEWLANQARILAGHIATESGMTAATLMGATARAAAQTAAGQTSILEDVANAFKAILAGAGQTVAGVAGNVAPFAGPAAPAIGAAAGASVLATAEGFMGGFDVGSWSLPASGFAFVHQNEMIVPGTFAGGLRDALSGRSSFRIGGGVGSGPDHGAQQTRLMQRMLSQHEEKMTSMVASHRQATNAMANAIDHLHQTLKRTMR